MADKKINPETPAPKKNLMLIGVIMLILGGLWSIYEYNPGMALREETPDEKKERERDEKQAKDEAKAEARAAAKAAARRGR